MKNLIIGSAAIKYYFPDFREPKDLDIIGKEFIQKKEFKKLSYEELLEQFKKDYKESEINELRYYITYGNSEYGQTELMPEGSRGGEGQGENWVRVYYFKDHDIYISFSGFYASYSGVDFYEGWNSISQVMPKQVMVTVYQPIK